MHRIKLFLLLTLIIINVACSREHETYTLKVCTRTMEIRGIDNKSQSPKEFSSFLTPCRYTAGGGIAGFQGYIPGKIENNNEPGIFFDEKGQRLGEDKRFENATVKMACYPNQMNANMRDMVAYN